MNLYYKFIDFKWHLLAALRIAKTRMKYPVYRAHSYSWSKDDHSHICIALRLLERDDFEAVCPRHGKISKSTLECDNKCDYCKYQAIIDYDKNANGEKGISLYISEEIQSK